MWISLSAIVLSLYIPGLIELMDENTSNKGQSCADYREALLLQCHLLSEIKKMLYKKPTSNILKILNIRLNWQIML